MSDRNKNAKAAAVTNLITGAKKLFTNGKQMVPLDGKSMTVDDATAELQTFVDNRTATVAAQATAKTRVAAENAQAPVLLALIVAFEAFVRLTVGNDAGALAGFGLAPHKVRTPMTAVAKAVAAAKREATRKARGTTSAKQKKSVKGNVTAALVVTPAPAPAAAEAPVAQPAPAAPAAAPAPATAAPPKA
jgi:hypothetical protein